MIGASSKQRASPIGKNSRFVDYSPKKAKDPQCNGDIFVVSGKAATYMDEKKDNFGQENGTTLHGNFFFCKMFQRNIKVLEKLSVGCINGF